MVMVLNYKVLQVVLMFRMKVLHYQHKQPLLTLKELVLLHLVLVQLKLLLSLVVVDRLVLGLPMMIKTYMLVLELVDV